MTQKDDRVPQSSEAARQARGLERFLMFSDGVAAIAVTLLVLPLVDTVTSTDGEGVSVDDILNDLRWEIFSFVLSFVVIVVLWLNHQQVFQNVTAYSVTLLRAGVVWLFAIVTLSFTTALVADHGSERITVLLYIINLGLAMASLTVATLHLQRNSQLLHDGTTISPDTILHSYINLGLLVVAFGLVLVFPGLGFWVMALLFFDGLVLGGVRRLRRG